MKPREKRTTTEPGLGKVSDGSRKSSTSEAPISGAPISAPPISGVPMSARHTRDIESIKPAAVDRPSTDTKPVDTRVLVEGDRIVPRPPERARSFERRAPTMREEIRESGEIERDVRTDIVTPRAPSVETPRSPGVTRPADRTGPHKPFSSTPPGKPSTSSRAPGRRFNSTRPPAGRPATNAPSRPVSSAPTPPPPSGRPVKSARASIRIDDVGAAAVSGADAVGVAARQIPKVVKTKAEIAEAPIDHRAGFLLAHIDGVTSVQGLVDIAGMPENEVHEILDRLRRLGIVVIR